MVAPALTPLPERVGAVTLVRPSACKPLSLATASVGLPSLLLSTVKL